MTNPRRTISDALPEVGRWFHIGALDRGLEEMKDVIEGLHQAFPEAIPQAEPADPCEYTHAHTHAWCGNAACRER